MAGHSKWSNIKRQKAIVDAKRGAVFTKLSNVISLAAKDGGDPEINPALKSAIEQAKNANLPKSNIERAIKKGTGELAGEEVNEVVYEGILPNNLQFVLVCLTDNKNRSVASIRHLFTKYNGKLSSVNWNFSILGILSFFLSDLSKNRINLENLELDLIDQGIVDFKKEDDEIVILTEKKDLARISKFLTEKGISLNSSQVGYIAKEKETIDDQQKEKLTKFLDELDENEDINNYYHNIENL